MAAVWQQVRGVPHAAAAAVPHAVRAAALAAAAGAGAGRAPGGRGAALVPAAAGPAAGPALRSPVGAGQLPQRPAGQPDHAGPHGGFRGGPAGVPGAPALPEPQLRPGGAAGGPRRAPPRGGAHAAGRGQPGHGRGHDPERELRLRGGVPRVRPAPGQRRAEGAVCPRRAAPAGLLLAGRDAVRVQAGPRAPGRAAAAAGPRGRSVGLRLVPVQRRPGVGLAGRDPAALGPRGRALHPPRARPRRRRAAVLRLPAAQQQPHRGGQCPAHGPSGQHLHGEGGAGGHRPPAREGPRPVLRCPRARPVGRGRPGLRVLLPVRPRDWPPDQGLAGAGPGRRLHHVALGPGLGQPGGAGPVPAGERLPRPPAALPGGGGRGRLGGPGAAAPAQFPHPAPGAAPEELLLSPDVLPAGSLRGDGQRGRLRALLRRGPGRPGHREHPAGPRGRRAGRGLQLRRVPAGLGGRRRHRHRVAPPARLRRPEKPRNGLGKAQNPRENTPKTTPKRAGLASERGEFCGRRLAPKPPRTLPKATLKSPPKPPRNVPVWPQECGEFCGRCLAPKPPQISPNCPKNAPSLVLEARGVSRAPRDTKTPSDIPKPFPNPSSPSPTPPDPS